MHLTENHLRKRIRLILKELLGAKSKGGSQLQRALGGGGASGYGGGGGGGGGGYGYYDDDDAAYDISNALGTDVSGDDGDGDGDGGDD
jgi:hypothetical protein